MTPVSSPQHSTESLRHGGGTQVADLPTVGFQQYFGEALSTDSRAIQGSNNSIPQDVVDMSGPYYPEGTAKKSEPFRLTYREDTVSEQHAPKWDHSTEGYGEGVSQAVPSRMGQADQQSISSNPGRKMRRTLRPSHSREGTETSLGNQSVEGFGQTKTPSIYSIKSKTAASRGLFGKKKGSKSNLISPSMESLAQDNAQSLRSKGVTSKLMSFMSGSKKDSESGNMNPELPSLTINNAIEQLSDFGKNFEKFGEAAWQKVDTDLMYKEAPVVEKISRLQKSMIRRIANIPGVKVPAHDGSLNAHERLRVHIAAIPGAEEKLTGPRQILDHCTNEFWAGHRSPLDQVEPIALRDAPERLVAVLNERLNGADKRLYDLEDANVAYMSPADDLVTEHSQKARTAAVRQRLEAIRHSEHEQNQVHLSVASEVAKLESDLKELTEKKLASIQRLLEQLPDGKISEIQESVYQQHIENALTLSKVAEKAKEDVKKIISNAQNEAQNLMGESVVG